MLALRVIVGGMGVLVGLGMVMMAYAFGHCAAFGGTCPASSSFDGEVFRFAGMGAALAVGAPVFVSRPSRDRVVVAGISALIGGVVVGFLSAIAVTS